MAATTPSANRWDPLAKFTSTAPLNIRWFGNDLAGPAGSEFRIPDALYEEFVATFGSLIPGLTWTTTDEIADGTTLPIAQTDVTGLTASLAAKADVSSLTAYIAKTGGTATGAIIGPAFRAKGDPVFNVKAYGAVGDGSTDDSTAAQAAADAAAAAGGGTVYFPAATYRLTQTLQLGTRVGVRGAGAMATALNTEGSIGINYASATTVPESDSNLYFAIEGLWIIHEGASAAIRLHSCINWHIDDLRIEGSGASGNGLEIIDSYFGRVANARIRVFPTGKAIVYKSQDGNGVQPGQVLFHNVVASTASVGISIDAATSVIDSLDFVSCVITNCTSRGLELIGAAGDSRNVTIRNIHIEQSETTNTATAVYQSGTATNLDLDGVFIWGYQTPFNFTGTIRGLYVERVYANSNSVGSPAAIITASSSVDSFQLGNVIYTGYTAFADSSDATTRRKVFAGARPVVQQSSSALTLSTTATDITGASYTASPAYPETWTIIATVDVNITSADPGVVTGQIIFDGTTVGPSILFSSAGIARATVGSTHVITGVVEGSVHTVKLQGKKANAGGTAVAQAANTRMTIIRSTG